MCVETLNYIELENIDEEQLPAIILGQIQQIKELDEYIAIAAEKAENAKKRAETAKGQSAGLFQKKEAIVSLQQTAVDLAEAQEAAVDAQTVSFEYQKKLGEITKYLFALGCTNMASNRVVVRELKHALEGASAESLDELAKREIINVIQQLKSQEDIFNKQYELSKKVQQQDKLLGRQMKKDIEHDWLLKERKEKDNEQDAQLEKQIEKDEEHDRLLKESKEKDSEQDAQLAEQIRKDKEHDRLLEESIQKNSEQDEYIQKLIIDNMNLQCRLNESIENIQLLCKRMDEWEREKTEKRTEKKTIWFIAMIAILALLLAGIQFFV